MVEEGREGGTTTKPACKWAQPREGEKDAPSPLLASKAAGQPQKLLSFCSPTGPLEPELSQPHLAPLPERVLYDSGCTTLPLQGPPLPPAPLSLAEKTCSRGPRNGLATLTCCCTTPQWGGRQ